MTPPPPSPRQRRGSAAPARCRPSRPSRQAAGLSSAPGKSRSGCLNSEARCAKASRPTKHQNITDSAEKSCPRSISAGAGKGICAGLIPPRHQTTTISATISTATNVCRLALELAPREPTHQTMAVVPSSASSSCASCQPNSARQTGGDVQSGGESDRDNR